MLRFSIIIGEAGKLVNLIDHRKSKAKVAKKNAKIYVQEVFTQNLTEVEKSFHDHLTTLDVIIYITTTKDLMTLFMSNLYYRHYSLIVLIFCGVTIR